MLVQFIDKNGNWSMLETNVDANRMSRVEKLGNTYFERKVTIEVTVPKQKPQEEVKVEPQEEIKEEVKEEKEFDEQAAKQFLKDKKVRGYGLLKWESLKKKAIEYGFNS